MRRVCEVQGHDCEGKGSDMHPTSPLSKEQIKTLGMLLGLSHNTVMNDYEDSSVNKYLDSILSAWFKKQDKVIKMVRF